ncbi:MAG: hypothetical protein ACQETL_09690 [Bacteroidota bacterium]
MRYSYFFNRYSFIALLFLIIYAIISQNLNNSDICEKDSNLQITGVVQDYKIKPESRGTPYFKINGNWQTLSSFGYQLNSKKIIGDSIIKVKGETFLTIYTSILNGYKSKKIYSSECN